MKTITNSKTFVFALLALMVSACSPKSKQANTTTAGERKVTTLQPKDVVLFKEYPTTIEGKQTVEIRPRVSGYIEKIYVDEGDHVKKGQTLFSINADNLRAQVNSAEAQVKVAKSKVETAELTVERTKPLVEQDIVSEFELKTAETGLMSAKSALAEAQAALASAQANLNYAIITSPVDGVIGNFPYRVGALVSSTSPKPLTTVSDTEEMYAYFAVNEKEYFALLQKLEGTSTKEKIKNLPPVKLELADGLVYNEKGKIETASGLVDVSTGSVLIRANFPNSRDILRSGASGKVRMETKIPHAIVVPQSAISVVQNKHFVYVLGADNTAVNTPVEVRAGSLRNYYVVTKGLKAGDKVIIDGVAKLKDGMKVEPKDVQLTDSVE
ncbi:MAG: efflux RND transporter periplasmic adaptor subunit [Mangrovibacterium sp.]